MKGYLIGEPRPLGLSAAIAIGAKTWIVDITAPASANAGDLVNVEVKVYCLPEGNIYVSAFGLYGDTSLPFAPEWLWMTPYTIGSFTASFIMPNKDTRLHVGSYYYTGTEWIEDDTSFVDIALGGVPPGLAEIQDIWYWDPSTGSYNPALTEPPTISLGAEAGAQFIVYNLSDEYLDLGLFISAKDPLGNSAGASIAGPAHLPPGGSFGSHYRVVTDRPGTYTFTVDIITSPTIPYGVIGTLENVPVAHVVGEIPPVAGHVYGPFISDATTGESFYHLDLPAEIDGGHRVIIGINWMNDGGEAAIFTPTFELVDPDGISRATKTLSTMLSPGAYTGGQTGVSVELDKTGTWKIHAILRSDGIVLDEKTWDAVATVVVPPGEGVVQIESVNTYVLR